VGGASAPRPNATSSSATVGALRPLPHSRHVERRHLSPHQPRCRRSVPTLARSLQHHLASSSGLERDHRRFRRLSRAENNATRVALTSARDGTGSLIVQSQADMSRIAGLPFLPPFLRHSKARQQRTVRIDLSHPMTTKPATLRRDAALREMAQRCVWWRNPAEALANRRHFLAHAMTFGTWRDACLLRRKFNRRQLLAALKHAPPGVFDPASWHYWHRVLGQKRVSALPARRIPGCAPSAPTSKFTWHLESRRDVCLT